VQNRPYTHVKHQLYNRSPSDNWQLALCCGEQHVSHASRVKQLHGLKLVFVQSIVTGFDPGVGMYNSQNNRGPHRHGFAGGS
jgi:hypothetical protein